MSSLGRDRVVCMRGRFLVAHGTFRIFRENGLVLVVCGQGAGRLRAPWSGAG